MVLVATMLLIGHFYFPKLISSTKQKCVENSINFCLNNGTKITLKGAISSAFTQEFEA
jgi:hypothetical protein